MAVAQATLVRSALLRTAGTSVARPFPTLFTVPGLAARPFWDVDDIPLVGRVVAAIDDIRVEYANAARHAPNDYQTTDGEHKLHRGNWAWRSIVTKGVLQPAMTTLCPKTAAALLHPDLLVDSVPFAYAFFSTLHAGAEIAPHYGPSNIRLRVHIPLEVPSVDANVCGLSVGGHVRAWDRPLVFDDSFEHSTWNRSASERAVLLFDVWHPELAADERAAITRMFDGARAAGWLK